MEELRAHRINKWLAKRYIPGVKHERSDPVAFLSRHMIALSYGLVTTHGCQYLLKRSTKNAKDAAFG